MKVRQDPPAANGISGTKGGERPRNHSEISGSYGYGHDRLRVRPLFADTGILRMAIANTNTRGPSLEKMRTSLPIMVPELLP